MLWAVWVVWESVDDSRTVISGSSIFRQEIGPRHERFVMNQTHMFSGSVAPTQFSRQKGGTPFVGDICQQPKSF